MHDLIRTTILGLIEGITKFPPISSTGHLLTAEHRLGQRSGLFQRGIPAGAILAISLICGRRTWEPARRWRDHSSGTCTHE